MIPNTSDTIARSVGKTHGYVIGCLHALIRTGSIVAEEYRYSGAYYDGREMHPCYILQPRAAGVLMACIDGKTSGPVHCSGRGSQEERPAARAAKRSTSRRASMKELIPVQQSEVSGKQVKTVNARDLHSFLESKQDFTTWIKDRIEKYGFAEGIDFTKFHNFVEKGYKPRDEYALTLDMAKELSMVERNARGKQARQYFIECERVALKQRSLQLPDFTNPAEAARAWAIQYEQKESALKRIEMDRPKVEFAETVSDIKDGIEIGDLAKVTYDRFGVGRNKLFSFLRDNRVLLDDNMPYQRYLDMGWFIVKEGTYWNKKYEKDCPCFKTLVTGKGQLGIFRMLSDKLGVPNAA